MPRILGLDIGGANIKAASSETARTVAFPLWKDPGRLGAELQALAEKMLPFDELAVTMTGELCDCFANKREGVQAILRSVQQMAPGKPIRVWCNQSRFLTWDEAWANPLSVAAANWLALSHLVAGMFPNERILLIDVGSTTTDIVFLNQGVPEPRGLTDIERLTSGELVYTGVKRTPVCAVLGLEVAAEFFACVQDAYVILELRREDPEDHDTADGRPVTRPHAHARLARMLCADTETFSMDQAKTLAEQVLGTQARTLARAARRVLEGRPSVQGIVLSGSGEVLGRLLTNFVPVLSKIPRKSLEALLGPATSEAACAYAVAMLAKQQR